MLLLLNGPESQSFVKLLSFLPCDSPPTIESRDVMPHAHSTVRKDGDSVCVRLASTRHKQMPGAHRSSNVGWPWRAENRTLLPTHR